MTSPDQSRRSFLAKAVLTALGLPMASRLAFAGQGGNLPPLPLDNPQARALAYTDDASSTRHPSHKPGSTCANCRFFTPTTGACTLFPGFSVAPAGWCLGWAAAPSTPATGSMMGRPMANHHMGHHG